MSSVAPTVGSEQSFSTSQSSDDFEPVLFFFYGSLMAPEVLKRTIRIEDEPVLIPGEISAFEIMLWGPYPALVRCEPSLGKRVKGVAYEVMTKEHMDRLIKYEGPNYAMLPIAMELKSADGQIVETSGRTFVWNGNPTDLRVGTFDLEVYRQLRR